MTSEPLSEEDREALANTIRWHMRCDNEQPGQYQSLCIANVENIVARIRDEAVAAARADLAVVIDEWERQYGLATENLRRAEAAERALVERMTTVAVEMETRAKAFRGWGIGDAYSNAVSYICAALDVDRDALSARPEAARGEGER